MMTPPEPHRDRQSPWQHPPPVPPPWHPLPPKRNTGRIVVIVVIVVLVLAAAGVAIILQTRDRGSVSVPESTTSTEPQPTGTTGPTEPAKPPDQGACVEDTSRSADDAEIQSVPCDAPEAVYKVAKTLPEANADCPGTDYTLYYEEGADGFTMCLMLNAEEGDCFINVDDINENVTRVDCAQGEFKAVKVVEGEAAESACPADDAVVPQVYPEPPASTVCLEAL